MQYLEGHFGHRPVALPFEAGSKNPQPRRTRRITTTSLAKVPSCNFVSLVVDGFSVRAKLSQTLPHGLNEGDLVDLFQRSHAQPYFIQRRFAEESHPFFPRRAANLRRWPPAQNHFPDAVAQIQQFVNRGSA